MKMKNNSEIILMLAIIVLLLLLLILAWAPWMDDQAVYNQVLQHNSDGIRAAENICGEQLKIHWFPFGRYVANCEIGYFVTFWGEIKP